MQHGHVTNISMNPTYSPPGAKTACEKSSVSENGASVLLRACVPCEQASVSASVVQVCEPASVRVGHICAHMQVCVVYVFRASARACAIPGAEVKPSVLRRR